jgi:signal transduction histidine kinase
VADGTEQVPRAVSGPPYPEAFTQGSGANTYRTPPPPPFSGPPKVSGSKRVPTKRDRWKLWNWKVRTKLFAVLLVPALAAGVLGSVQVSTELGGVEELGRTVRQVELGSQASALVHEVQYERALMAGFVAFGRRGDRTNLDLQKRRVDGLAASLRSASGRLDGMDQLVRSHYLQAINALGGLAALREVAETQKFSDQSVIIVYTSLINSMLELSREIARATVAKDVSDLAGSADALGRSKEQVSQQHAIMLVAILHNQIDPNQAQDLRVADSRFGAAVSEFRSVAKPVDRQRYDDTVTGPEVDERERIKLGVLQRATSGGGDNLNMNSASVEAWDRASGRTTELINKVQTGLLGQLRGGTITLREQAGDEAVRDATILLGSLLLTLLLVVVVARSMLVPLRVLKNTAFDVADRRLPEAIQRMRDAEGDTPPDVSVAPVAVHTREEIGQVARAFDAVHGEAVRLAAEQALLRRNVNDMFVNLSRRSQGLVERQLRLIDQLESKEQDPEQLSNLFQLDHLATRMRRNSENLLVLAGADLARRSARPISAVDVLRAALSEVEDYKRVTVQLPPTVSVHGIAVNDIVHLIAELLDNATTFSPPHTRVVVSSRLSGQGEFVVEISDQGVGMTEAQLAEANQRLAHPPTVDVSVSRRMGLYVVGRLASRNNIRVRLEANGDEGTGLTAIVEVPNNLVQTGELDTTVMPASGADELLGPRSGDELLAGRSLHSLDAKPGVHDDYPSDWPDRDTDGRKTQPERQQPAPYEVGATAPMQVTMVDSVSGADLFTPASVPTISQQTDSSLPRPHRYGDDRYGDDRYDDVYAGSPTVAEEGDYQDYADTSGRDPYRAWPDTDQDVTRETTATVAMTPYGATADSVAANGSPEPVGEDFLGVSDEVVRARTAGAVETTPIYEEMVSAWFRETTPSTVSTAQPPPAEPPAALPRGRRTERPAVVSQPARPRHAAQTDKPAERLPARPPAAAQPPAPEPVRELSRPGTGKPLARPAARSAPEPERVGRPARSVRSSQPAQPGRGQQPDAARMEPAVPGPGQHGGSDDWTSPADVGWRAAGALVTPGNNGFTSAGLPKRRKGANLVPGAALSSAAPEPSRPSVRNPDSVRGRLASYQQGLRQGRDARHDLAHAGLEHGSDQAGQQSTNEERQ